MTSDINETKEFDLEALRGHTPAPWAVGDERGAEQLRPSIQILRHVTYVEGVRPTTYAIGDVTYPTTTGNTIGAEERKANARLIAAAPELFAECERLREELTARRAREEAVEAIAAADNTLHSAMDHWQERAIRAEAALRARDAEVGALVAAARRAEVSFNTVGGCYERNPGNFMMAMRELEQDVVPLRAALLPFHPSGSEGESK